MLDPRLTRLAGVLVFASLTGPGWTQSTVEDFEDLQNEYSWAIGPDPSITQTIEPTGGNPGAYLRDVFDFFAAQVRVGSVGCPLPFQGDYVAQDVVSLSFDCISETPTMSGTGRPITLRLRFGLGTLDSTDDIWADYESSFQVPQPGDDWVSFEFPIVTTGDAPPSGWSFWGGSVVGPATPPWSELMTDVCSVFYYFGDPSAFYPDLPWDVGVDNLAINYGGTAFSRGDCNVDSVVDIADAVAALAGLFVPGSALACDKACDANDDGATDISDPIQILQTLFVAPTPLPDPTDCGADPTPDSLTCDVGCP